jgi:SAM-dependent methyltransferase
MRVASAPDMAASPAIVALLAARNEGDIIRHVVKDLIAQGLSVYLLDDGSTDDTVRQVEEFRGRGLIAIEHLRETFGRAHQQFEWARILDRKAQLASEIPADWFIHHDADEFREAPWPGVSLREGINRVDALGYNAIDFAVFDFVPTDDRFCPGDDVRQFLTRYRPGAEHDRVQVRCWKRTSERVDLASSGGHEAAFPGRRVFPLPFLLRHYPIRSEQQGRRKVFEERQPKFLESERRRGWHVQYDAIGPAATFVVPPETLPVFDADRVKAELLVTAVESRIEVARFRDVVRERDLARLDSAQLLQERDAQAARVADLTTALHEQASTLAQRERSLRDVEMALAAATQAHEDRVQEAATARQTLEARLAELVEARAHVLAARRLVAALYASRSWRVTRPLRAVYELMTGAATVELHRSTGAVPKAGVEWGDFGRLSPISSVWGTDRGLPVDRYYIHRFLERRSPDIRGRVLEVKDPHYAHRFGGNRVTAVDVVDIDPANVVATVIADLTAASEIESLRYDAVILTQTLHTLYDLHAAVREIHRVLKIGGVVLATLPAVSRVNYEDGGLVDGDFWRLTRAAVSRLFGDVFGRSAVDIETSGNVRVSAAFLYGLAVEDLDETDFALDDPWFPLIHCVRAVKRGIAN